MGPASASFFRSPLLQRASFLRGWICESTTNPPFIFDGKQTTHFRPRCCGTSSPGSQHFVSQSPNTKILVPSVKFCSTCGGTIERRVPKGEHELRAVCTLCGCVHYQNPKMIVGCLVEDERKVLLCKRSIQPSYGLWTLPAGYMELGESAAEGAVRETREEAQADVEPVSLFAHLDIPRIGQSYIIFRARFKNRHFAPGSESLECGLFDLDEIPFNKIAFSSVNVALQMYLDDYRSGRFKVHHAVIDKRLGTGPSDSEGFVLRDHLSH